MRASLQAPTLWIGCLGLLLMLHVAAEAHDGLLPGEAPTHLVVEVWSRDLSAVDWLARHYDLWSYDPRLGRALVLVPPEGFQALREAGFAVTIEYDRTERFSHPLAAEPTQLAGIPGFPCYRTVEETFATLEALATAHPNLATWVDIGDSWEKINGPGAGYDLRALVLSNSAVSGPKYPFVLMAAMHARELATAELVTRFAESLIHGHGVDPDLTWLLDYGEIHIIPHLNPDGRKRAEGGLSWRKNVDNNHCTGSNSRGIDLNRNSNFFWAGTGSSSSACSEVFRGPSAASEPETQSIHTYFTQVFEDQRGPNLGDAAPETATGLFISVHSFSELILFPWEGSMSASPNDAGMAGLARKLGFFTGYLACQDSLPPAGGTTVDMAYGTYGVAAFTFEIGQNFFESCNFFESNILSQNLAALRFAAKAARQPYAEPRGPEITGLTLSVGSVVAGTPVTLTASANDTRSDSHGCGAEPAQAVVSASYTVDLPPWLGTPLPLSAADGNFNSSIEGLVGEVGTGLLSPGRHTLFVFASDSSGRQGPPTAIFLEVTGSALIFEDGFETGDTSGWSLTFPG